MIANSSSWGTEIMKVDSKTLDASLAMMPFYSKLTIGPL